MQYRGLLQCQEFNSNLNKKNSEVIGKLEDERSTMMYNKLMISNSNISPRNKNSYQRVTNSNVITSITDKNTKNIK